MAFGKVVRTFCSAHLRHIKIDGEVGIPQCHPAAARLNRQRQEIPTRRDARSMQRCASKLCAVDGRDALHQARRVWIATATRPGAVLARLVLTMATHCDHATNMSIMSQHVSIVESRSP
jgi:hypothetical protein